MRPTIIDVARHAGVSTATVDRVINDRPGVKPRTRRIVLGAARRLGYLPDGDPSRDRSAPVALDFVLPAGTNAFMLLLAEHLRRFGDAQPDVDVTVHRIDGFTPGPLADRLRDLAGRTQGVGVVAIDHPLVREAIRDLAGRGVRVATLVSDVPQVPTVGYVGIDNRAAGRLAGYIMGRFLPPAQRHVIGLFAGSLAYRGHQEREMGFRHIVSTEFDAMRIARLTEVEDDSDRAYEATTALLSDRPDIAAIYNIGAGTDGICRALKERRRDRDTVFIAHDLTDSHRPYLLDGTIDALIDQYPRVEAREIINLLRASVRGEHAPVHPPRLQVVFRENMPDP